MGIGIPGTGWGNKLYAAKNPCKLGDLWPHLNGLIDHIKIPCVWPGLKLSVELLACSQSGAPQNATSLYDYVALNREKEVHGFECRTR